MHAPFCGPGVWPAFTVWLCGSGVSDTGPVRSPLAVVLGDGEATACSARRPSGGIHAGSGDMPVAEGPPPGVPLGPGRPGLDALALPVASLACMGHNAQHAHHTVNAGLLTRVRGVKAARGMDCTHCCRNMEACTWWAGTTSPSTAPSTASL